MIPHHEVIRGKHNGELGGLASQVALNPKPLLNKGTLVPTICSD